MGTQQHTELDYQLESNHEPNRNLSWFKLELAETSSDSGRAWRTEHARSQPVADVVSGGYWSTAMSAGLSYDKVWIDQRMADLLRSFGLNSPTDAMSKSIIELIEMRLPRSAITVLIGAACLPPRRIGTSWMSIGECLYKLLPFDAAESIDMAVSSLSISSANQRLLARHGVVNVARLLFTHPVELRELRGVGHRRFSEIVASLVLSAPTATSLLQDRGRHQLWKTPFADWISVRLQRPTATVIMAAERTMVDSSADPGSVHRYIQHNEILGMNETQLRAEGVSTVALLNAMSILTAGIDSPVNSGQSELPLYTNTPKQEDSCTLSD